MSRALFIVRSLTVLIMYRFKLADLQIRAILRKPSAQLAKSALDRLTKNVNEYYKEAMERITSQKETKDMVYNLLTWLTFTRSPIHVHELELALSIRPGQPLDHDLDGQRVDVLRYVSLSEGLISINKSSLISPYDVGSDEVDNGSESETSSTMDDKQIRTSKGAQVILAHESIREFLRDVPQLGIPANGDKFLLNCCLTLMSSPVFVGNLQPIWQQSLYRIDVPWRAKKGFSVNFGNSAVEVPVFLFWVLSSWGQYVSDTDLIPDMANAIQKIHESDAVATRACLGNPWPGPLYWCAYEGWAEACKLLLPLHEDPNAYCKMKLHRGWEHATEQTCLFAAVASGNVASVQVFLDDDRIKPDLGKQCNIEGHVTPLMQACEQGDRDIVRMLLSRNDVDVNAYDDSGLGKGMPVMLRVISAGIITLLLERDDLDMNMLRLGRRLIHHLASIGGPPSELELVLENAKTDVNGRTADAIREGSAFVSRTDKACFCHERTALMVAAFVGHPAQTSVLLKHPRIDLQLRDSQGMTALMLASVGFKLNNGSVQQHYETVRVLLTSLDWTINERDLRGRTALMFASMGGVDPKWDGSEALQEELEGLDLPDHMRHEHLEIEASLDKSHHAEIVKALLRHDKVDVNISDDMGHTALDYAMWTRDSIIEQRDWEVQTLKEVLESIQRGDPDPKHPGFYEVPDEDVEDIMANAQSRIDAMSKIHDVLSASGAHSGEPIAPLADRSWKWNIYRLGSASEIQQTIESATSALESIVERRGSNS